MPTADATLADLGGVGNLDFAEELYRAYQASPHSVAPEWRAWFAALDAPRDEPARVQVGAFPPTAAEHVSNSKQERVDMLVRVYRVRGHVIAKVNPLGGGEDSHPELDLPYFGLSEADLDTPFSAGMLGGEPVMTLREIIAKLRRTYCGAIGVQFMHIDDPESKDWLQGRMESSDNHIALSRDQQVHIFSKLAEAEAFETFLQKKFVGAKRFSLEGAESLIPLIDMALERAAETGVQEVVVGMAHRGRLNVLANIMGKNPSDIFREFEDQDPHSKLGRGDVKYHMGYTSLWRTQAGREVKLQLCFNPSHLEFVGPVAVGRARARQDRRGDAQHKTVMPLLIHGDAAFAGQGVVQELLNMSELSGYRVGGAVHIIVNNQVGFTTPPESSRSSRYCTDVAKMLQAPIFHVNGEHPEGVAQVIDLAIGFREKFRRDVFIDMYCYRRHGHNEGDDPTFTQPVMYQAIRARKSVVDGYLDNLVGLGGLSRKESQEILFRTHQRLEEELAVARTEPKAAKDGPGAAQTASPWKLVRGGPDRDTPEADTAVPGAQLERLAATMTRLPDGFVVHPKLGKLYESRLAATRGEKVLDWGAAEVLAFASLLAEGRDIRLSGQDSGRGTFSHRHAVLHDYQSGARHVPLQHLGVTQGQFNVYDSPLSEAAVLGFDYGYSLDAPEALVLWEAQFGDFANGAQVIIDQFIVSCEDKWNKLSGLVLVLPHGFEGQGPEHSSARLERFLNLAAEDNIQVVNLTTPANLFHCLRRQVLRRVRKPLIMMSPKSLLRHPMATSPMADLATGRFQRVLIDPSVHPMRCSRVLLCSGKVYYDLVDARAQRSAADVALVRVEQLYPLSDVELQQALLAYPAETPVRWVQEEPLNMGAWPTLRHHLGERLFGRFDWRAVARPESASPATGSNAAHKIEQALLMDQAFGG
ncbi:MAG: 2-oxoglutarate dehydrogenase E1 component [Deltaproteobacteria bacterium]|nr:2-oxoglutarate dehydrogenase E1 component [Deltaproteobacteria bacterium]